MSTFDDIIGGGEPKKKHTDPQRTPAPAPPKKSYSNREMIDLIYQNSLPTPEEAEANRKRERRQKIISAFADGMSSIANLVNTSNEALDTYDPSTSLSARAKARWDKYHTNIRNYRNAYIADKIKANRADAAAELEAEKAADERQYRDNMLQLKKAGMESADRRHRESLEAADRRHQESMEQRAKDREQRAKDNSNRNATTLKAANIRASNSGGGSGSKRYYGTFRGKEYKTAADYNKAVLQAAKEYPEISLTEIRDGFRDAAGNYIQGLGKTVDRKIQQVAVEIEDRDRQKEMAEEGKQMAPAPTQPTPANKPQPKPAPKQAPQPKPKPAPKTAEKPKTDNRAAMREVAKRRNL